MTEAWDPKDSKGLTPVQAEEDEERNDECQPRFRLWPAGEREPGNPPRWSLRLLRKWWRRRE